MAELYPLTDLRQMDLQTKVYVPAGASTLQRIRSVIENWEANLRKSSETGGFIEQKPKKNILIKMLPKAVADHLIMNLQNYPTFAMLKQHAIYKADLLMKFHPESNRFNLARKGHESDEEWPEEDLECNLCNDDALDVVQQLMAVFKKYGNRNQSSSSSKTSSASTRSSRCLTCESLDHHVSKCPKP